MRWTLALRESPIEGTGTARPTEVGRVERGCFTALDMFVLDDDMSFPARPQGGRGGCVVYISTSGIARQADERTIPQQCEHCEHDDTKTNEYGTQQTKCPLKEGVHMVPATLGSEC
jgi:hypothetical protein